MFQEAGEIGDKESYLKSSMLRFCYKLVNYLIASNNMNMQCFFLERAVS